MKNTRYFTILFVLVTILVAHGARAAKLFMLPTGGELAVGQSTDLEVRIDSEGQGFNAAQATILFPKDIFEVRSLDFSPQATIFNFWLEEPKFSNQEGNVTFVGGTTSGIVGASVPILKITFKAKGTGQADIVVSDAAITASDGSGTNILSTTNISRFVVKPTTVAPPPPAASPPPIPPPAQITRKPAPR